MSSGRLPEVENELPEKCMCIYVYGVKSWRFVTPPKSASRRPFELGFELIFGLSCGGVHGDENDGKYRAFSMCIYTYLNPMNNSQFVLCVNLTMVDLYVYVSFLPIIIDEKLCV